MELLNQTETGTNFTDQLDFSEQTNAFKASGILHLLLVVIPVLTLGPLVLGLLISNKNLRDPASILFMCITCVCILGPSTYGLLMDISLITNVPTLGSCKMFGGRVFWFQLFLYQTVIMVGNSLLAMTQYTMIRWGKETLPVKLTVPLFLTAALLTLAITFLSYIPTYLDATTSGTEPIRGSYCLIADSFQLPRVVFFLWTAVSTIIVGVFSFLIVRYVKKNMIENKKVVRDVQIIMIAMTISVFLFRFLPPLINFVLQITFATTKDALVQWAIAYSSELGYTLFLVLILLVHKVVRNTLIEKMKSFLYVCIKRRSNKVSPASSATEDTAVDQRAEIK